MIRFINRHNDRVKFKEDTPGLKAYIYELINKGSVKDGFFHGDMWIGSFIDLDGDVAVMDETGLDTWMSVRDLLRLADELEGDAPNPPREFAGFVKSGDRLFAGHPIASIDKTMLQHLMELFND